MADARGHTETPAPALIIFDCDGVLVDSEPLAIRVLIETIAEKGIAVEVAQAYRDYLGRSLSAISQSLHDSHGEPLGDAAARRMRDALFALYRSDLKPAPGLPEMLERLSVPYCVASSSQPERIAVSLEVTGLWAYFAPHVFSATMVASGKPAPDLFLYAAREMGVAPQSCLVIEDSPAGISAAQAAGMAVFAYTGGSHIEPAGLRAQVEALGPNRVFDDMHALPDLLTSWPSVNLSS